LNLRDTKSSNYLTAFHRQERKGNVEIVYEIAADTRFLWCQSVVYRYNVAIIAIGEVEKDLEFDSNGQVMGGAVAHPDMRAAWMSALDRLIGTAISSDAESRVRLHSQWVPQHRDVENSLCAVIRCPHRKPVLTIARTRNLLAGGVDAPVGLLTQQHR
jgi:hypothetical protein